MTDMRFEQSALAVQFTAELAAHHVKLPLRVSDEDLGVVLDAGGRDVFTVDSNGDRPDGEVEAIALWIVCAVNTCGGYAAANPS